MSTPFDPRHRLALTAVTIVGPVRSYAATMAVDTGATRTVVAEPVAVWLGFDVLTLPRTVRSRGVHADGSARVARLTSLTALGRTVPGFELRVMALNPTLRIDGLLGIDFFRDHVLTLDFARGRIGLHPPRAWWRVW